MDDKIIPPVERMLAERVCERVIVDFIRRLDLGDPSSVAELFTPDGVWYWPFGDRRIEGGARPFAPTSPLARRTGCLVV